VVQHVADDVQHVESSSPHAGSVEVVFHALGEGDHELSKGGRAAMRVDDVGGNPVLAFLEQEV